MHAFSAISRELNKDDWGGERANGNRGGGGKDGERGEGCNEFFTYRDTQKHNESI